MYWGRLPTTVTTVADAIGRDSIGEPGPTRPGAMAEHGGRAPWGSIKYGLIRAQPRGIRATVARGAGAPSGTTATSVRGYYQRSQLPWTSLLFLMPYLIFYEVGTRRLGTDIIAFTWMQGFFRFFGAYGRHLPAMSVVGILLAWHIARKDNWHVPPGHLLGMFLESFALTVPLILLARLSVRYLQLLAIPKLVSAPIVLSVGAGIYEELIFRLISFTVLSIILIDLAKMRPARAYLLMVVMSSLAFSLYHYLGSEPFNMRTFAFRTAAGLYFGGIFVARGFGISAGSHAAYDIVASIF